MAFPGKVMADSETQKLERKDFLKRIVEKVYGVGGGVGGSRWSFQRDIVSVRFFRIERHVPHVGPACDFIQICRVKRLLLAGLRDDRWYNRGWNHQETHKEDFPESQRGH